MQCITDANQELKISVQRQKLFYFVNQQCLAEYVISTAQNGIGSKEGSYQTPIGHFQVSEKFGIGQPIHTVFRARAPIASWICDPSRSHDSQDLILSRILRLSGLQQSNGNTYLRYIYIHGTNHESDLGTPTSIGCIRMSNRDIIDLYNTVSLGTVVTVSID